MAEIAILAKNQLAAWEYLADTWPTKQEVRDDNQTHATCLECHKSIWVVTDRWSKPYRYQDGEIKALLVDHLRRKHPEWESLVYRMWEVQHARTIT